MPLEQQPNPLMPAFSVLLIDDSEEDRYSLRRLLRRSRSGLNFDIREADTGARGLALCRERLPHCLLLDYSLNDTDGLSLLAELNAGHDADDDPVCPVVIITGTGTISEIAVRALKEGAQDYLLKETLTSETVVLAIENAVEKVWLRRKLRTAEARFRSSLDNMLDCFCIYTAIRDQESGGILDFRCDYVNEAARRSKRMMPEAQGEQILADGILPVYDASRLFEEYIQVVETGRPVEKTDFIYGAPVYGSKGASLESAFHIRVWKMGDGFAAAWRDITAQKRAEERLREAEEMLAVAVDASESGGFEVDIVTGQKLYTPRTFDLLGIPPPVFPSAMPGGISFGPVENQAFSERVHAADRDRVEEARQRAYDPDSGAEGVFQTEYRVGLADGTDRWIASKGRVTFDATGRRPVRLAGLLQDVTARKLEQQMVQQLAAVVENSEDFIAITTTDGNNLFVNAAGRRLVGLTDLDTAVHTRVTDYFFPEDVPRAREVMHEVLTTGHASVETRFRHFVSGEAIDVFWNLFAIHDTTTGQPYALATVTRDIRDQKRIEAERAEIARRREQVSEAVQRSLLLVPPPDAYPGITVQPFYQSAGDEALIGGDFFDVFAVSEDVVALVVGDATGKGVEAALYTAEVRFALRAFLREHRGDLPTALRLLNGFVADNRRLDAAHHRSSYIALVAVLVNVRTGEAICCCAGAEPPLILRAGTGEVVEASAFGPLLGAFEAAEYTATQHNLGIGDLVALTTDGITEARPAGADDGRQSSDFFGIAGLAKALREEAADADRGLAEVKQAVVRQALAWAGGEQHDDICLLLAKRL